MSITLVRPSAILQGGDALELLSSNAGVVLTTTAQVNQVTRNLYTDVNRTDLYTPDGSVAKPFKTIQGAIDKIAANNDDTLDPYNIYIQNGKYYENLIIESSNIRRLRLTANGTVQIRPVAGAALRSTANNSNLKMLHVFGVTFLAPIVITGASGSTAFDDVIWDKCNFVPGDAGQKGDIQITCINNFSIRGAFTSGIQITFNNLNYGLFEHCNVGGGTALSVTMDSSAAIPSWGWQGGVIVSGSIITAAPTFTLAGPNKAYQFLMNSARVGGAAQVTIPTGLVVTAYASFLRGTWNNSGTISLRNTHGDAFTGTLPTLSQPASQIANDSAVPNAATVKDALTALYNRVFSQAFEAVDTLVVTHGLNKYPSVTVIDPTGEECEVSVEYMDANALTIYMNSARTGVVKCN